MVFVCFCYPLKTNKGSTITRKTFDFHLFKLGAEDGTQTRDPQLGRLMLYQLSYFRKISVGSDGFEPPKATPAELQSAPFGHSGNCPMLFVFFRASCRIRTNDPEITNHVLWPTELKRQFDFFQTAKVLSFFYTNKFFSIKY